MPVKYLQNPFAISVGSVIVAPLNLNKDDNKGFLLFKLVTSFISFQVFFRSFLANSNCLS